MPILSNKFKNKGEIRCYLLEKMWSCSNWFNKRYSGMKCKKCGGLMVLQSFFDHFLNFDGWKCLNCGKVVLKKEKTLEFDAFSIFYQQQKCKNRN